jgi:hypothetical protein
MTRPPPEVMIALARASNTLLPWLQDWRQRELDQLPYAAPANVATAQGRCQLLTELYRLVQGAPDVAAKLRSGASNGS